MTGFVAERNGHREGRKECSAVFMSSHMKEGMDGAVWGSLERYVDANILYFIQINNSCTQLSSFILLRAVNENRKQGKQHQVYMIILSSHPGAGAAQAFLQSNRRADGHFLLCHAAQARTRGRG